MSQGRLARADSIGSSLSSSHLVNFHHSDSLVKFFLKERLQLLECNSLLHTYYPGTYAKSCSRCGFYADTVSHALNGCRESKNSSQQTCLYSRAKCERPIFPCDNLGRSYYPAVKTLKITVSYACRYPLYLSTRGLTYVSLIMRPEPVSLLRCRCLSMSLCTNVTKINLYLSLCRQ